MNPSVPDAASIYQGLELTRPEQEIRLLRVCENLCEGLLDCRLSRHYLRDARFVVLSYQWGSQQASHKILLNGSPFLVRGNLFDFLCVIREQQNIYLWIDALCINQTDFEERNRQVRIMGRIFCSASMVLSWLGTSNAILERAFDLMSQVWDMGMESGETDDESLPRAFETETQDDLWHCVAQLCQLPYWHRVWVVQEVLLSSNNYLLCGNKTLTWQEFASFMSLVNVRFKCPPHFAKMINESTASSYAATKPYIMVPRKMQWSIGGQLNHDYGKSWQNEQYNLFRIITMFGERDCTDTLDHIYALLSLSSEGLAFPIRYGIPAFDLLLNVFHFCGQSSAVRRGNVGEQYRPVSQRALIKNVRFLAEILQIVPVLAKPVAYFHGASGSARNPDLQADPHFPCQAQTLVLDCIAITPGDEPPILRSKTLRRHLSFLQFNQVIHINESSSWLFCAKNGSQPSLVIVAVVTIKEGVTGRGFRILEPGLLAKSDLRHPPVSSDELVWELHVPAEAHLAFLKTVVLGMQ